MPKYGTLTLATHVWRQIARLYPLTADAYVELRSDVAVSENDGKVFMSRQYDYEDAVTLKNWVHKVLGREYSITIV